MHRGIISAGIVLAGLSVLLGAFGAHSLKAILQADSIASFQTGVQYQFYHSLALILCGILMERFNARIIRWAGICFIIGVILFSGSLYVLTALRATETVGMNNIGILTPIGGLFFITAWILLLIGVNKRRV